MRYKNSQSSNGNSMWIYGRHAVKAALENPNREHYRLITLESTKNFLLEMNQIKIKAEIVDKNVFAELFGKDAIHQGCAILAKRLPRCDLETLAANEHDNRPFVFLDQITDPQNIGSIMRASAVFGAQGVVVTDNNSPELTPAIAKMASGAIESIPLIVVTNLVQSINKLKKLGFWCVGLDERANQKIYEQKLNGKMIIVIGSEGGGMRRLTRETCDFLVQFPSHGEFSTLNAAQAATVSLYEISKQNGEYKWK